MSHVILQHFTVISLEKAFMRHPKNVPPQTLQSGKCLHAVQVADSSSFAPLPTHLSHRWDLFPGGYFNWQGMAGNSVGHCGWPDLSELLRLDQQAGRPSGRTSSSPSSESSLLIKGIIWHAACLLIQRELMQWPLKCLVAIRDAVSFSEITGVVREKGEH